MSWWSENVEKPIATTFEDPRKIVRAGGDLISAGLYPVTAPFAYLGGLQRGGWEGGASAVGGLTSDPTAWWSNPENQRMMALTAGEVAATAATAGLVGIGLGGTATIAGTTYSGLTTAGVGIAAGTGAAALAAGAALSSKAAAKQWGSSGAGPGEAPPDVNEANDPKTAEQFQRIRRAARMLGRAGTIKFKGSATSLGLGDGTLGDQLSLIGS